MHRKQSVRRMRLPLPSSREGPVLQSHLSNSPTTHFIFDKQASISPTRVSPYFHRVQSSISSTIDSHDGRIVGKQSLCSPPIPAASLMHAMAMPLLAARLFLLLSTRLAMRFLPLLPPSVAGASARTVWPSHHPIRQAETEEVLRSLPLHALLALLLPLPLHFGLLLVFPLQTFPTLARDYPTPLGCRPP